MASDVFPSFLDDGEKLEIQKRIREIAEAAIAYRLSLLIGAGFSKDAASLPLAAELARIILIETYAIPPEEAERLATKYELGAIAARFVERSSDKRNGLLAILRQALTPVATRKRSQAEEDLGAIASIARLKRIFTTNYDNLIELALDARARPVAPTVTGIAECEQFLAQGDCTAVYHLNGDLANPKITEAELRDHYTLHFEELRHRLCSSLLVMIGYSFRDDVLVKIFDEIRELLQSTQDERITYLIMPVKTKEEYKLAERLWDVRGSIRLLPFGAGGFLGLLRTAVEQTRTRVVVREVATELSRSEEEIDAELKPLLERFAFYPAESVVNELLSLLRLRDT